MIKANQKFQLYGEEVTVYAVKKAGAKHTNWLRVGWDDKIVEFYVTSDVKLKNGIPAYPIQKMPLEGREGIYCWIPGFAERVGI